MALRESEQRPPRPACGVVKCLEEIRREDDNNLSIPARPVCGVVTCLEILEHRDQLLKKLARVRYDLAYRTEADGQIDLPVGDDEEDLEVVWERKNLLFEDKGPPGEATNQDNAAYESEKEEEIDDMIKDLKKRQKSAKKIGGSVNGECIYYDESLCCVRNIHCSSFSLTEYGEPPDHDDFGRRKVMRPILTSEERGMLGIPPPATPVVVAPPAPKQALATMDGLIQGLKNIGFRSVHPKK